jgi:16S rRNA (adenine1518-N6/adenine1519-N6)-dimethyltransferase
MISQKLGVRPDSSKDQHFLTNPATIRKIIGLSSARACDVILEVGAGIGTLTEHLIRTKAKIIAVEIDRNLGKVLNSLKSPNLEIRYENVLKTIDNVDFNKIVSNTPYSICEPLLNKMTGKRFDIAVMSIPEKFYGIISSKRGDRNYSTLSVKVQCFFDVSLRFRIPKEEFSPKPRTETVVVTIKPLGKTFYSKNPGKFVMKEIFLQKRKKLKNSLLEGVINFNRLIGKDFTKNMAREAIKKMNIGKKTLEKEPKDLVINELELLRKKLKYSSCTLRPRAV